MFQIISQAEARAHRIGQEDTVIVQYLMAPNTSDDSMWLMLQEKQETLKEVGLCKENFDNVEVKKQLNAVVTEGLNLNASVASSSADIRTYFSPQKKRKHLEEEEEDMFNDGFDEILCKQAELHEEEFFNDGMDEVLCDIDF